MDALLSGDSRVLGGACPEPWLVNTVEDNGKVKHTACHDQQRRREQQAGRVITKNYMFLMIN